MYPQQPHHQQHLAPQQQPNPYVVPVQGHRKPSTTRFVILAVTTGILGWVVGLAIGIPIGATANTPAAGHHRGHHATATPTSTPDPTTTSTPDPTTSDEPTPDDTQTTIPKPTHYRHLTARQWKQIAKDPDAHAGEHVWVYGEVVQFDAATGDDTFRAQVGGVRDNCAYGVCNYPTNTLLNGSAKRLSKVVEDDRFKARVTILGSVDYDTSLGGQTTAPALQVDHLSRL